MRLTAQSAESISLARNTLTEKLWDSAGVFDVMLDTRLMKDGQRVGFAFMSGSDFGWVGVGQENGIRKIMWEKSKGPVLTGNEVWLRGINEGDSGRLLYSFDGKAYADTGVAFPIAFRKWKGGRIAVFSYGPNGGSADFDYIRYRYNASLAALGMQ